MRSHTVDISGLLGGGATTVVVDDRIHLDPFEMVTFPRPADVHLEVRGARSVLEIAGTVNVVVHGQCDRCLEDVDRLLHVDVDERLETGSAALTDPFGESNVLAGERLDVADLTNQVVCSAVPLGLLCGDDCAGICPSCGMNNNTGSCSCKATDEEQQWQT